MSWKAVGAVRQPPFFVSAAWEIHSPARVRNDPVRQPRLGGSRVVEKTQRRQQSVALSNGGGVAGGWHIRRPGKQLLSAMGYAEDARASGKSLRARVPLGSLSFLHLERLLWGNRVAGNPVADFLLLQRRVLHFANLQSDGAPRVVVATRRPIHRAGDLT
jgi:hypothetical protein